MTNFLKKVLLFLVPIILACVFIDIFITKELKKRPDLVHGEYSTWNDLFDGKINSDIVIYGSSRAWVHISPQIISDSLNTTAYNLGIDGHNFWLQYLRHSLLLKHNRKPKLIIHSLDEVTLQKRKELYNLDQFLPYMLLNKDIKDATASYEGFTFFDYILPAVRYYGKETIILNSIEQYFEPKIYPAKRIKGYQGQDRAWNSDFDNAKKKMKYYEVKIDTPSLILFERYLKECKANGINIVFVYTPEYIEGQLFVKNRKQIIDLYTNFSVKYKIPFYDYSKDTMSYQKKYFYNALHLNKTGAELFTTRLTQKLKSIYTTNH